MDEKKDFQTFMTDEKHVPKELDYLVLGAHEQKHQHLKKWFWPKLASIHFLSAIVTLSFCPQFGIDPFQTQSSLPHLFMSYGMWACGLFCGVLFFSIGSALSTLLLSQDEFLMMRKRRFSVVLGFSSVALASLMLIGAAQNSLKGFTSLSFIGFWFLGAILIHFMTAASRDPKFLKVSI